MLCPWINLFLLQLLPFLSSGQGHILEWQPTVSIPSATSDPPKATGRASGVVSWACTKPFKEMEWEQAAGDGPSPQTVCEDSGAVEWRGDVTDGPGPAAFNGHIKPPKWLASPLALGFFPTLPARRLLPLYYYYSIAIYCCLAEDVLYFLGSKHYNIHHHHHHHYEIAPV